MIFISIIFYDVLKWFVKQFSTHLGELFELWSCVKHKLLISLGHRPPFLLSRPRQMYYRRNERCCSSLLSNIIWTTLLQGDMNWQLFHPLHYFFVVEVIYSSIWLDWPLVLSDQCHLTKGYGSRDIAKHCSSLFYRQPHLLLWLAIGNWWLHSHYGMFSNL